MGPQSTSVKKVFISYDTEDKEFAERLADDLRRLGVPVWISPNSILPGEGWVEAIERGLQESSHVVIVLTPAAVESNWVKMETNAAIARERQGHMQVVPLDVEECQIPLLWSHYQRVSFREDYSVGLNRLAAVLGLGPTERAEVARPAILEPDRPFEPEMVLIPAGEFLMGSDYSWWRTFDKRLWGNEQPQHTLHLPDYYMAKTPVTNAQYATFVEAGYRKPDHWEAGKPPAGKEDHPAVNVPWRDALAYCNWLAEATGKPYRLPSEAEWEKAARGTDGRIWPWGDEWDKKRCNSEEGGAGDTTPVGTYPDGASPYGLLDMAGNVDEWTLSLWGKDEWDPDFKYPYDPEDGREDPGTGHDIRRVVRGGAWDLDRNFARCASRLRASPSGRWHVSGFRTVVAPISP